MLNNYVQETRDVCKEKGWEDHGIENVWMLLMEEIGELASAVRRSDRKYLDERSFNVENELMDVFSYLLQIAEMYQIDLDREWKDRCVKYKDTKNKT